MRWHRKNRHGPEWVAEIDGVVVAEAAKTGTHLDNYPWDWHLTDAGMKRSGAGRTSGVTDTLRAAKSAVAYELLRRGDAR